MGGLIIKGCERNEERRIHHKCEMARRPLRRHKLVYARVYAKQRGEHVVVYRRPMKQSEQAQKEIADSYWSKVAKECGKNKRS
jgi:hypothetical protein